MKAAELADLLDPSSYAAWGLVETSLRLKDVAPSTIDKYAYPVAQLFVHAGRVPLAAITRAQVSAYLLSLADAKKSRGTRDTYFRALRSVYNYLLGEDIVAASPVDGIDAPQAEHKHVPLVTPAELKALLRACEGKALDELRDTAFIKLAMTPGAPRASELCGLAMADFDPRRRTVLIRCGKWARDRVIGLGDDAGRAMLRYLAARGRHPMAGRTELLFLGKRGAMTASGLRQMMERRCLQAGIARIYPHQLRHTTAAECRADGMDVTTAKALFGWSSDAMWAHYGAAAIAEQAITDGQAAAARIERRRAV